MHAAWHVSEQVPMLDHNETRVDLSHEQLASIVADMATGMVLMGDRGQVLYANHAARSILEIRSDTWGSKLDEIAWHAAFLIRESVKEEIGRTKLTMSNGLSKTIGFKSESLGHNTLLLIWDFSRFIASETRRSRADHLAMTEKLASRLSHEIKNPLASVLAGLQTLEKASSLSVDDLFILKLVLDEVRSLSRIVHRLLDSVRTDMSQPSTMSVESLLRTGMDRVQSEASKKDVTLRLVSGEADTQVMVDRRTMEHALDNLLRNALDATSAGGDIIGGWRELGEHEKSAILPGFAGAVVGIYVEDSGKGIPQDLSESAILRPFVTTKKSNIGLGLSVAQEIVELHGGVIFLSQPHGVGATFEILLPSVDSAGRAKTGEAFESGSSECHSGSVEAEEAHLHGFCWVAHGREQRKKSGNWPEVCLACSVFKSHNLSLYFDRRDPVGKDT